MYASLEFDPESRLHPLIWKSYRFRRGIQSLILNIKNQPFVLQGCGAVTFLVGSGSGSGSE